jgi:hypothetical protein
VGGRSGIIYHKCAYCGCIIIIGTFGGSTTLDIVWDGIFPSKIGLDIPLHHIPSLLPNRRRYNMTKRPMSYARAHPKRRVRTIYPAGRPATIIITELASPGAFRHLTRHC